MIILPSVQTKVRKLNKAAFQTCDANSSFFPSSGEVLRWHCPLAVDKTELHAKRFRGFFCALLLKPFIPPLTFFLEIIGPFAFFFGFFSSVFALP